MHGADGKDQLTRQDDPCRLPSATVTKAPDNEPHSRLGLTTAILGIGIAVLSPCIVLYYLALVFGHLWEKPSTSCRPVPVIGFVLSILSFPLCCVCAVLAKLLGTKADAALAASSVSLAPLSFLLDLFGTIFVIWATGSSLGS